MLVDVVHAERRGEREQGELQEGPKLVRPRAELAASGELSRVRRREGKEGAD